MVQTFLIRAHDGTDWGAYKSFVVRTASQNVSSKDILLQHPLSQGITGFTYDKDKEDRYKNDNEFKSFGTSKNFSSGFYTKGNPLENHNFHKAWAYGLTGKGLTAHVVDDGFDLDHQEFSGKNITIKDSIESATGASSLDDHGHVVMGIIGANRDGNLVTGGAPDVDFKVSSFRGSMYDLADRTRWAAGNNTVVQNNSWGCSGSYNPNLLSSYRGSRAYNYYADAIKEFQKTGVIVKSLANDVGGDGINNGQHSGVGDHFPIIFPELKKSFITVANADRVDYANGTVKYLRRSEACGLTASYCIAGDAYKVNVLKNYSGLHYGTQGTSFMAPQVSAAVALVAQAFPNQTPEQWTARLLASANNNIQGLSLSWVTTNTNIIGYR